MMSVFWNNGGDMVAGVFAQRTPDVKRIRRGSGTVQARQHCHKGEPRPARPHPLFSLHCLIWNE